MTHKTEIFWFSGTGNSLAVAMDIAEGTEAVLTPVASLTDDVYIGNEIEAVGFVFPVYDFKAPKIVDSLVERLRGLEDRYVFAVCTYGISPLKCLSRFSKLLATRGTVLNAGFAVMMPHNAVGNSIFDEAHNDKLLTAWKERSNSVADIIRGRREHPAETRSIMGSMLINGLLFRMIRPLSALLIHAAVHGWKSLSFSVNDACIGCETCSHVCPVGNVAMRASKPEWGENCTSCFACIQWCPNEAIQLGTGKIKVEKYHHPQISSKDLEYKHRDLEK